MAEPGRGALQGALRHSHRAGQRIAAERTLGSVLLGLLLQDCLLRGGIAEALPLNVEAFSWSA
jgi:hypothetical protein